MNNNQISKLLHFLFVNKQYGIKEMDEETIWLLKNDVEYPIVCICLKEKSENYYEAKWQLYRMLLKCDTPLLMINHQHVENYTFAYHDVNTQSIIQEFLQSTIYQTEKQDNMLKVLQAKFKYPNGIPRYFTITLAILSLIVVCFQLDVAYDFLLLKQLELFRLVTPMITGSFHLLLIFAILYHYESMISIQKSRKYFVGFVLGISVLNTMIQFLLQSKSITSGLSVVVVCILASAILQLNVIQKNNHMIRIVITRLYLIQSALLFYFLVIDFRSSIVGVIFAIIHAYYVHIRHDKTLRMHARIAFSMFVISVIALFIVMIRR